MNESHSFEIPEDWITNHIQSFDNTKIRVAIRRPKAKSPKKAILFINGRTEFIEKYNYIANDLQLDRDCLFVTYDHRGQGFSEGKRSHISSYNTFAKDLACVIENSIPIGLPYIIVAHSMGALITLYATLNSYAKPIALILTSPLLGIPSDKYPRWFTKITSNSLKMVGLGHVYINKNAHIRLPFEANQLTNCPTKYKRLVNPPTKYTSATFGWIAATLKAIKKVFKLAKGSNLKIPICIIKASNDTIIDNRSIDHWLQLAKKNGCNDITMEVLPGSKHEVLSETSPIYDQAIDSIRSYVKRFFEYL